MPSIHDQSYDGSNVATDVHRVRLAIGDTDPQMGVLPGGRNFSDAEISAFIDAGGNWQRGVMYAFLALGARYAAIANRASLQTDPEMIKAYTQLSRLAVEYRMQAEKWDMMTDGDGEQDGYAELVGYADTDSRGNAVEVQITLARLIELNEVVDLESAAND